VSIGAVVLAAGQGTRMKSRRAKVLHEVAGRPMLSWVLSAVSGADVAHTVVVVGQGAEGVSAILPDGVETALQAEQLGTGHATQMGLAALDSGVTTVIVLCGDAPLVDADTIAALLLSHTEGGRAATMVTTVLAEPGGYGRVIRGPEGEVDRVVEARDASTDELAVTEINTGVFAFDRRQLESALGRVSRDNAQGEAYLPDVLGLVDGAVGAVIAAPEIALGINDRTDLAACEAVLQDRMRGELMRDGVTMPDPSTVYLEPGVTVGSDSVLLPGTHLRGATTIGEGCQIGPGTTLENTVVGDGARVVSSHAYDADIAAECEVGPFAYLRPGAQLERGAKAGTFVEIKKSVIGQGAKVPHLSYIGDADVGEGTNIGAGNITANYDGFRKHRTVIGSRVKTGSDCVFVAPVRIGDDTMTGAGSIITDDIPDGALGIARARQSVIEGFTAKASARAQAAAGDDEGGGRS
jgi:bifunctional UDP-N-acetylglucosamine pyrophosphorylase/glucosamine-1-phosphate N-acetyltransferase